MRLLNRSLLLTGGILALSGVEHRAVAQKLDPCRLVTKAEAARILGKPAIAKAQSVPSGAGTCAYHGSGFEIHTKELESPGVWGASMREMIEEKRAEAIRN